MAAQMMLTRECPHGVDLTAKPWCQRKVIVVLGDGDPGLTPAGADYFAASSEHLPMNLLQSLNDADIEVHALTLGVYADLQIAPVQLLVPSNTAGWSIAPTDD